MPSSSSGDGVPSPRTITSTGSRTLFRPARKPPAAGSATNCLACPAERDCIYSALRIYRDMHLRRRGLAAAAAEWPLTVVCPDIEDDTPLATAETHLLRRLAEDYDRDETPDAAIARRAWYGRCVYESDNSVCDDQVVTITWDGDTAKTATFHMIAPTEKQCQRRGRVYGTQGELSYDGRRIRIYDFRTRSATVVEIPPQSAEEEKAHGGGDYGLTRAFVAAVDAVENEGWDVQAAQARFVGCTLEEVVRSHAVVFAAEEARREEKVVRWREWWEEKLAGAGVHMSLS
ncbi:hypothetical protein VTN02DRAFT_6152 [Thermoascus thermophilus]